MPTSPLKKLPLARPSDPVLEIDESIELYAEDLLDIDGSDDQTLAAPRSVARKLMPPPRKTRSAVSPDRVQVVGAPALPPAPPSEPEDDRVTMPFGIKHAAPPSPPAVRTSRMPSTPGFAPAHFAFAAAPPRNPPPERDANSTFEPVSSVVSAPAHFLHGRDRKVSSSFPPVALAAGGRLSFIQDRPSRVGWIAAGVLAIVLLAAGSMRVQANTAPAVEAPTPRAAAALPETPSAPAPETKPEAKVVTFGEDQGVAIKPTASAKAPAASPATPVRHAAPKPATPKPASTLSLSDSKPKAEKPAEKSGSGSSLSAADKKKLADELAEAQLRAASR